MTGHQAVLPHQIMERMERLERPWNDWNDWNDWHDCGTPGTTGTSGTTVERLERPWNDWNDWRTSGSPTTPHLSPSSMNGPYSCIQRWNLSFATAQKLVLHHRCRFPPLHSQNHHREHG